VGAGGTCMCKQSSELLKKKKNQTLRKIGFYNKKGTGGAGGAGGGGAGGGAALGGPGRRVSVSICTFVLVKQVTLGVTWDDARRYGRFRRHRWRNGLAASSASVLVILYQ
jgi:hypothetical protein